MTDKRPMFQIIDGMERYKVTDLMTIRIYFWSKRVVNSKGEAL